MGVGEPVGVAGEVEVEVEDVVVEVVGAVVVAGDVVVGEVAVSKLGHLFSDFTNSDNNNSNQAEGEVDREIAPLINLYHNLFYSVQTTAVHWHSDDLRRRRVNLEGSC